MSEADAIVLAVFEDEPKPSPCPAAAGPRPADRPRPDPSSYPPAGPISLVALDSDTRPERTASDNGTSERAALAFDICLFDPETASFLVVYSAGTPLDALKPRTVSIPSLEASPPATSLTLYAWAPAEPHPVPYLTLPCSQGSGGRLTLRFADPADPRSLVIEHEPCHRAEVSPS